MRSHLTSRALAHRLFDKALYALEAPAYSRTMSVLLYPVRSTELNLDRILVAPLSPAFLTAAASCCSANAVVRPVRLNLSSVTVLVKSGCDLLRVSAVSNFENRCKCVSVKNFSLLNCGTSGIVVFLVSVALCRQVGA
ncbi:hypothetical protein BaRGS_00022302 [Batillaria attramentaria]|uniref:Uncharacterized protein n=1 Tax=Batillaria attramentaria TaxID=370345 RepID=A0ABD0KHV0_9CAEN